MTDTCHYTQLLVEMGLTNFLPQKGLISNYDSPDLKELILQPPK
jgi:hypothetical protein